jgi:hypothetical protein
MATKNDVKAAQDELNRLKAIQAAKAAQAAQPQPSLQDEIEAARVRLVEAQEAEKAAALAALRPQEFEHEKAILRLLEPLVAEIEKAQATGAKIRRLGEERSRYPQPLMVLPDVLAVYRQRLAKTFYTDQQVLK